MNTNSIISPEARIGRDVTIGPFTVIHDNVEIGDGCTIGSHCALGVPARSSDGRPLVIGPNSTIRSHSVFYEGSTFGANLQTGHGVLVRENTRAGKRLQIGTNSDIEGECTLGDFVRLHSEVHVSQQARVGDLVWLYPRVQFTNDPFPPSHVVESVVIGDLAVVATNVLLLPGVRVGLGAFVGAGSVVRRSVADAHCVSGDPAEVFTTLDRFMSFEHGLRAPWPRHFKDAYPEESHGLIDATMERIEAALKALRQQEGE